MKAYSITLSACHLALVRTALFELILARVGEGVGHIMPDVAHDELGVEVRPTLLRLDPCPEHNTITTWLQQHGLTEIMVETPLGLKKSKDVMHFMLDNIV